MKRRTTRRELLGAAGLAGALGTAALAAAPSVGARAMSAGSKGGVSPWDAMARIVRGQPTGFAHAGWAYDHYPELPQLSAHSPMVVAHIDGPAVITTLHFTQHLVAGDFPSEPDAIRALRESARQKAAAGGAKGPGAGGGPPGEGDFQILQPQATARGVVLEIYFNGSDTPSVRAPLADFFADGCNGRAVNFSTPFVEKAPKSYNAFIPMPFEKSAKVVLVNETEFNLMNYSSVEWEELPQWDPDLGYFHATWDRRALQVDDKSNQQVLTVKGAGHLMGRAMSIATDDPAFGEFSYLMEGNNEIRLDGEAEPRLNYLGTEDAFGFSWGFQELHTGLYNGINFVRKQDPSMLSLYRFHGPQPIRFRDGLDLRINHGNEWAVQDLIMGGRLPGLARQGRLWADYALTHYWYQDHVGFDHKPMAGLEERGLDLLHSNN